MICVSISEENQVKPALEKGAVFLELRLDLIRAEPGALYENIPSGVKTLVTCRPGPYTDQERSDLIMKSIKLGANYIDLELESGVRFSEPLQEKAAAHGCDVIFSHHDFKATPETAFLEGILEECYLRGGGVAKIATMVS
jgi:3-dehydroquinate dehydratase type I